MDDTGNRTGAARAYDALIIASVVLPLLVFLGGSWLGWTSTVHSARTDLDRSLAVSMERATRVLDTHRLIAGQVNELLRGMDDAAVTAHVGSLRDDVLAAIRRFPQVGSVTVTDRQGRILLAASGDAGDRPAVSVAQAVITALRDPHMPFFIDATGNGPGRSAISLGIRRGDDPRNFPGIILVSASDAQFAAPDNASTGQAADRGTFLLREDGGSLWRYPPAPAAAERNRLLLQAIERDPVAGTFSGPASSDGHEWLIHYRKLDAYPVYVGVERSWDSIVRDWRELMVTHLIFGIPATLALCALSVLVARRARREGAMLAELRAEVRRREIAEDALRQSQKMEALGRLTGGIAHDFNNHLTVVSSNIELLKRRLPANTASLIRLADSAMQGVQRAATLTHRLLAFSRQQPLDPEPLDMGRLVSGMSDLLRRTLGEDVVVETALANGLWLARVDANQVENALLNLAVNARDAMPRGGRLTIRTANVHLDDAYAATRTDAAAGDHVMISVTDTGTGMSSDVIAKVFEPFFTTKPLGQGTGLGLSMVYGFVRQSGGSVAIDSQPGRGSTIALYLPRYQQQVAPLREPASRDNAPASDVGETVLVVEDDEDVRHSAVEALHEMGYQVLEAPDAMEAIRLIADRGGIDLLFTDVGLPGGVDGRALADAARSASPSIRILFTTGYSAHAVQCADTLGPGVHFLAKPFTLQELGLKVRGVLDAPSADQPMPVGSDSA